MASCLVHSSLDLAVWVRVLAGDIVLCSWALYFYPGVKWEPVNLMLGVILRSNSIPLMGWKNIATRFMLQKQG